MKKMWLLFAFSISLYSIYIQDVSKFNEHKEFAHEEQFNAVGAVFNGSTYGTGTLIHPRVVLTAGHVVRDYKYVTFQIRVNNRRLIRKGIVACHPKFQWKRGDTITVKDVPYDIALVILTHSIHGVNYPTPSSSAPNQHEDYYVAGYGLWNGVVPSKTIDRKLAGQARFSNIYKDILYTSFDNSKGLDLFAETRKGDSGSPLISMGEDLCIHGVLSSIHDPNSKNKNKSAARKPPLFSVYARVDKNFNWILNTIKEHFP